MLVFTKISDISFLEEFKAKNDYGKEQGLGEILLRN